MTYLSAFAGLLAEDPRYHFRYGREKFILPIIRTLGRPFSIPQIYKIFAYFGEKYARGSVFFETVSVTESSAILRIKFTDSVYRQFGNYRKAYVANICEVGKGALAAIPEAVHHLKPATVKDRACIVNDDEYCEWEFHWEPQGSGQSPWLMAGFLQYAARLRRFAMGLPMDVSDRSPLAGAPSRLGRVVHLSMSSGQKGIGHSRKRHSGADAFRGVET